jgi:hypothetical protein
MASNARLPLLFMRGGHDLLTEGLYFISSRIQIAANNKISFIRFNCMRGDAFSVNIARYLGATGLIGRDSFLS